MMQAVNVFYGPSGVGKTTMLRAVAEGQWALYTELPEQSTNSTKLRARSSSAFLQRLLQRKGAPSEEGSLEPPSQEDATEIIYALMLAKLLVLLVLHTAKRVTEPADWMQAQLNGYDMMIFGISILPALAVCCFSSHASRSVQLTFG